MLKSVRQRCRHMGRNGLGVKSFAGLEVPFLGPVSPTRVPCSSLRCPENVSRRKLKSTKEQLADQEKQGGYETGSEEHKTSKRGCVVA